VSGTILITVDRHEDLVSFSILHLKDQHAEEGIIVGGTEEGVSRLTKSWELAWDRLAEIFP